MKRFLGVLAILPLVLSACGNYEGIVTEKEETSFVIEIPSDDAEETTAYEMHLTDGTVFKGTISSYEELEVGDQIRVIPFDVPEDFSGILPSEVIVE